MTSGRREPFYQARKYADGLWHFETPTASSSGFPTRWDCLKAAAGSERQDLEEAKDLTKQGPISKVLRAHFFPNGLPVPAADPLDLRRSTRG